MWKATEVLIVFTVKYSSFILDGEVGQTGGENSSTQPLTQRNKTKAQKRGSVPTPSSTTLSDEENMMNYQAEFTKKVKGKETTRKPHHGRRINQNYTKGNGFELIPHFRRSETRSLASLSEESDPPFPWYQTRL